MVITNNLELLLYPGLGAFVVALLSTFFVIKYYRHKGWLDDPAVNKHSKVTHKTAVPRGGGIPIFLAIVLAGYTAIGIDKHFLGILGGSFILMITGVLDDIYNISPYKRLLIGIIAATFVVASGIGIAYVSNPFGEIGTVINLNQPQYEIYLLGKTRTIWVLADIFAIIWIVWMMNIVNWSKGLDGQMPGFVAIAAVIIGVLSLRFVGDVTQWPVIKLAGITAGAYLGFLFWNMYPQKIMPGYGGGSLAGYLLAVLSILSGAKVAAMILILGIPIIDATYTIIRRLLQNKSPVWGDRGHLHHLLLDIGWGKRRIAIFYWFSTLILGVFALNLNSSQKIFTIIALTLILGGVILWLNLLKTSTKK